LEIGVVKLTNTKEYPFNNSETTVALKFEQADTEYAVLTEKLAPFDGVGEVCVFDKAVNGFKIAFNGSAKSADVRYLVF